MSRQHFIWQDGDWVEYDRYRPRPKRAILIRDQLGEGVKGIYNPATMQRYDSRSAYLRDTKAAGGEIVGNDQPMRGVPRAKNTEPIATTIERLNQQKGWGL